MRKLVRLTEGDLHRIVENSVRKALNEISTDTIGNTFQKSQNMNYYGNPKKLKQRNNFRNTLNDRYDSEISNIDPDYSEGYFPDVDEHLEIRNTSAYKRAYNIISKDFEYYPEDGNNPADWNSWDL